MGSSGTKEKLDPYVLAITIFAIACVAVAGTAVAIYLEVRFYSVLIEDNNDLLIFSLLGSESLECRKPEWCIVLHLQSFVGLGIFWAILLAITGTYVFNYLKEEEN